MHSGEGYVHAPHTHAAAPDTQTPGTHRTRTALGELVAHRTCTALQASSSLSFADEEEEEEAAEEDNAPKKPKLGKNPNVDTSMLPDADRQAET